MFIFWVYSRETKVGPKTIYLGTQLLNIGNLAK